MAESKIQSGFAAFLDLRNSTTAWAEHADLAEDAIVQLQGIVYDLVPRWKGTIGNFTGDGFLLLFPDIEPCIHAIASVTKAWEARRPVLVDKFERAGAGFTDELGLLLRNGVAAGKYRRLPAERGQTPQYAGEVLNRAQRCESASKAYYEDLREKAKLPDLPVWSRVFIGDSAYEVIDNKSDYFCTDRLPAEFKGYPQSSSIRAVWPRVMREPSAVPVSDPERVERIAAASLRVELADRLRIAATQREATTQEAATQLAAAQPAATQGATPPRSGGPTVSQSPQSLLERSVAECHAALKNLAPDTSPGEYARAEAQLARTLVELAPYQERERRLGEAADAYRRAAHERLFEIAPDEYRSFLAQRAGLLASQAASLSGKPREAKLQEVIAAFHEARRSDDRGISPAEYVSTQNGLIQALRDQLPAVPPEGRIGKLSEIAAAYRDLLRVRTEDTARAEYARIQLELGAVFRDEAQVRQADGGAERLEDATHAFREAARVSDPNSEQRAMALNDLGRALLQYVALLDGEARRPKLDEAEPALRDASLLYRDRPPAFKLGVTQNNLGLVLECQAKLSKGRVRQAKLKECIACYELALRIFNTAEHAVHYQRTMVHLDRVRGSTRGPSARGPSAKRAGRKRRARR